MNIVKFGLAFVLSMMLSGCVFDDGCAPESSYTRVVSSGYDMESADYCVSWLRVSHNGTELVYEAKLKHPAAISVNIDSIVARDAKSVSVKQKTTLLNTEMDGDVAITQQKVDYIFDFLTFSVPVSFVVERATVYCSGNMFTMPTANVQFIPKKPEKIDLEDEMVDGELCSCILLRCAVEAKTERSEVVSETEVKIYTPREKIVFNPVVDPWIDDSVTED